MSLLHGTSEFKELVLYWVLTGVACNRQPHGGCGGLSNKIGDRTGGIDMNRTGDIYMNRIALAVKSALGIAMLVPSGFASAEAPDDNALQEIVVTGIRKSVDESLAAKRASTEIIDVVTAEDIGKMPDKNVADSLSRLPGITTSSAGATEGGFDENDRVSMRGTNPSLTQTWINGHNIA
jgi:outer membrane receptor for monomeric catechols